MEEGVARREALDEGIDEKGYRWEKYLSSSFWTSVFRPF
jgi:hypothetical protein